MSKRAFWYFERSETVHLHKRLPKRTGEARWAGRTSLCLSFIHEEFWSSHLTTLNSVDSMEKKYHRDVKFFSKVKDSSAFFKHLNCTNMVGCIPPPQPPRTQKKAKLSGWFHLKEIRGREKFETGEGKTHLTELIWFISPLWGPNLKLFEILFTGYRAL